MHISLYSEQIFKFLLTTAVVTAFFIYGLIAGYSPIIGIALPILVIYSCIFYYKSEWFAYLYILTLSLAGLVHLPITGGGLSSAVAIALASFGLLNLGLLAQKKTDLLNIPFGRPDHLLVVAFFIVMIVSMMNSHSIGVPIRQLQQFFYLVVIYFFLLHTIRSRKTFKNGLIALMIGGTVAGLVGLLEVALETPFYSLIDGKSLLGAELDTALVNVQEQGRILGLIGDSMFHGMFMLFVGMVSIYIFITTKNLFIKICIFSLLILAIFNILGSGSRGVFLSAILASLSFLWFAEIKKKVVIVLSSALFIGTVIILAILIAPNLNITRSFSYSQKTGTLEMRKENIPVAIKMFADHPIIGNGPDGFVLNFTKYARNVTHLASRLSPVRMHNTPLQVLAEYGLIGATLFVLIIGMAYYRLYYIYKRHPDHEGRLISVIFLSLILAYLLFMNSLNILMDKYFWLVIMLSQVHYSIALAEIEESEKAGALAPVH